jgi:hypothetical protein
MSIEQMGRIGEDSPSRLGVDIPSRCQGCHKPTVASQLLRGYSLCPAETKTDVLLPDDPMVQCQDW